MHTVQWLKPSPLWPALSLRSEEGWRAPAILEFDSDEFMESMRLGAEDPAAHPLAPISAQPGGSPPRLYLPFHGRYYMAAASLVCQVPGFPDRQPRIADEESAGVVIRCIDSEGEVGWVPDVGWQRPRAKTHGEETIDPDFSLVHDEAGAIVEEVIPMFSTPARGGRQMWFAYLPLSSRETYESASAVDATGLAAEASEPGVDSAAFLRVPKFGSDTNRTYCVRCVYRRPLCPRQPFLVSERSTEFEIAKPMDLDAPSRDVRIELDVADVMSSLQQVKKNVGFSLSKSLGDVMARLSGNEADVLDGDQPAEQQGQSQICMFAIPVVTICAFILLMIIAAILSLVQLLPTPLMACVRK
jgi:hypothetical protein